MDREDYERTRTTASASAGQRTEYRNGSSATASQRSRLDPHSCLSSAKRIFSCYRRDEAQDPEGFTANLALVLGDYPAEIVQLAADPRTGIITEFPMGLPNVGQIREFLEGKLKHRDNMARLASLPKFERHELLQRPPAQPGDLANVFVSKDRPQFRSLQQRAATADVREYRYDTTHGHEGIWVSLSWFDSGPKQMKQFKAPSDEELRAIYGRPKADDEAA